MAEGRRALADGTRLEDLLDAEQRTLSARVHTDPELFELELERIFTKAWIPVAHVTELPEPGDFVTRRIGLDPVIVARGPDGELRVLLNVCSHRGMKVCRAELGSARTHTCPFHGWAFGSDGRLRGVPFEQAIYGDRLDKARLGLRQARVAELDGLVFATWDDEAPSLEDYVGDFRWYLDAMLARSDAGLEVSGPPQRFVIEANWKIVAEGFYGDAYHIQGVHRSFTDIGIVPNDDQSLYDFKASIKGHSVLTGDYERRGITGEPAEVLAMLPPTGMSANLLGQLFEHLEPQQIELLAKTPPSIAAIFPAAAIVMVGGGLSAGGPLGQFVSLRFFAPISPERTEVLSFSLVERDAPEDFKAAVHQTSVGSFGVAGSFEVDDVEAWEGVQSSLQGVIGRQTVGNYQAVGDSEHGDPTRPGSNHRGVSTDDNQWHYYERWLEFLEGRAW